MHVYGLTETYGPYTVCEVQDGWLKLDPQARNKMLARQGVGMVVTDGVRVVAPDLTDVPRDGATMGEVVMRGNNVMSGYFADPAATERAFAGGWFHSGDLGVWHPDGYIELRDRAKDIIIVSGGENISTIEVEATIDSHPAVLEVAVVGVPHEKWGESGRKPSWCCVPVPPRQLRRSPRTYAPGSRVSRCRTPSTSSPNCRKLPPERFRSSNCANASGRTANPGSKVKRTRPDFLVKHHKNGDSLLTDRVGHWLTL